MIWNPHIYWIIGYCKSLRSLHLIVKPIFIAVEGTHKEREGIGRKKGADHVGVELL